MKDLVVRIAGAQGEGVETAGYLFSKIAVKHGLRIHAFRQYGSIIKQAHTDTWYQIRMSNERIHSYGSWNRFDILLALNKNALVRYGKLARNGVVIYDPQDVSDPKQYVDNAKLVPIPMLEIATKLGNRILKNTVGVGALLGVLDMNMSILAKALEDTFGEKGAKIAEANIQASQEGYEIAKKNADLEARLRYTMENRLLMSGAEALSVGMILAGARFYAAYPMTPASPILHWLAEHGPRFGMVVVQAEDEIAAINMAIGAAYAGARAAVGTSGGGFSLMHEGVGLASMIEVPVVILEGQRGGPSTGLPTETEQSDLLMSIHPSQGDFPIVVLAPLSVEDALYTVVRAFNIAEKYQLPVIVLTDLYLNESLVTIDDLDVSRFKVDRGDLVLDMTKWEEYRRYKLTETGISPRTIPGVPGGMYIATSDEHDERGDVITDLHVPKIRRAMMEKRMRKLEMIRNNEMKPPEVYGDDAELSMVVWGSTWGSAMDAMEVLREAGYSVNIIAFRDLYPMNPGTRDVLKKAKRLVDVEVNYTGQLAKLISSEVGIVIEEKVLKYWGEPFGIDELVEEMRRLILRR